MPPLINLLQNADFKTKKEACWAISNATSGALGEPSQIRYMVSQGVIKPLCDLLKSMDNKIIQVRLIYVLARSNHPVDISLVRLLLMDLTTS
jgi:importin subunit alpha-1